MYTCHMLILVVILFFPAYSDLTTEILDRNVVLQLWFLLVEAGHVEVDSQLRNSGYFAEF